MNLEVEAGRQLARILAEDSGVTLKMSDSTRVPHTNGKTISMPTLRPEWDADSKQAIMWWSSLIHECYHHKGSNSDDFKVLKKYNIDTKKFFGMVLNLVVDHNIEHKEYGKLTGADEWMDIFYTDSYTSISEKFGSYPEDTKHQQALKALIAFDLTMRSIWSGVPNMHLEYELTSSEALDMFHDLMDKVAGDYLTPREGGMPNLKVTNLIMEVLDMDEEKDGAKSKGDPEKGDGDEGDGESGEGDSGRGKGSASDEEGEGESDEGKVDDKVIEMFYEDSGRIPDDAKGEGAAMKLQYDWSKTDTRGYQMVKAKEIQPNTLRVRNDRVRSCMDTLTFTLSDKVKNILKVMSQVKWNGGYKRGKIHKKALARITSGSDRIFRQREQKIVLDTAVTVLLDSSGSMMSREKYIHGMVACAMLNDALNKVGIPVEILGFSQTYEGARSHNEHFIHSTFGKRSTTQDLVESMSGPNLCNNDDGAAIMWAHSRLLRNKAKRKILIVLSDGSPACMQADAMPFTKKVVKEIEQKSPVELYGIGILDDNVSRIYKEWEVIKSPEHLETALLNVVKSKIIG